MNVVSSRRVSKHLVIETRWNSGAVDRTKVDGLVCVNASVATLTWSRLRYRGRRIAQSIL